MSWNDLDKWRRLPIEERLDTLIDMIMESSPKGTHYRQLDKLAFETSQLKYMLYHIADRIVAIEETYRSKYKDWWNIK